MNEFKKLGIGKTILDVISVKGFEKPSPIQEKTIPLILEGKDVIGNAATGSGKTLAFASGIIQKVIPGKGIQALVLTPTRELAVQICDVIKEFAKKSSLNIQAVYGGVNFKTQGDATRHAEVIVGTPGRILDHLNKRTFDFFELKTLVLDEADRMVDMGFLPDVEKIIGLCPIKRQTLLFSATNSQDVNRISKKYMQDPQIITVKKYVDSSKLKQIYYDVPNQSKFSLLVHLIKEEKSGIIMIFCNTRRNVDLIAMNLKRYGIDSHAIHGGLEQNKRSRIMEKFHANEANILVCTDVAARGLDIKGVTHVYNYDAPKTSEEYIHRIGRTARAGEDGMAISIISNHDFDNFRKIMEDDSLNIERKEVPKVEILTPKFKQDRDNRYGNRRSDRGKSQRGGQRGGRGRSSGRPNRDRPQRSGSGRDRPQRSSSNRDRPQRSNSSRDRPQRSGSSRNRSDSNKLQRGRSDKSRPQRGRSDQGRSSNQSNSTPNRNRPRHRHTIKR